MYRNMGIERGSESIYTDSHTPIQHKLPEPERKTVKEIVELDADLDERFRKAIIERKGLHKGVIKEAFEEAVEAWIKGDGKGKKRD